MFSEARQPLSLNEALAVLKSQGKKPTIPDIMRLQKAPLLGDMVDTTTLDPEVQRHPGLIALSDGEKLVSPTFQFENAQDGKRELNPRLANAWLLFKLLPTDQVKENEWATASRLTSSNAGFDGRSTAEALMDPETPDSVVNRFYTEVITDAIRFGKVHGITVVDPRTRLPEATSSQPTLTADIAPVPLYLPTK